MTEYYQIPVKYIHSSVPKSDFHTDEINDLALAIISSGCLLEPLIVKQLNFQSYELLSGHRNYYAALKAKEIDIRVAEMVSVFVVDDESYAGVLRQIELLSVNQNVKIQNSPSRSNEVISNLALDNFSQALQVIQSQNAQALKLIESQRSEFLQRIEKVEQSMKSSFDKVTTAESLPSKPAKTLEQSLSELIDKIVTGELQINITITQNQIHAQKSNPEPEKPNSEPQRSRSSSQKSIDDLTIPELKKRLKEHGIKFPSNMNKPELRQVLKKYYQDRDKVTSHEVESSAKSSVNVPDSLSIVSYDSFVEESMRVLQKLNSDYNYDNLVPIYHLRRELGNRVDRTKFNEWLLKMHAQSIFELMSGTMPDLAPDIVEDSVKSKLGSVYYSISLD